MTRAMSRHPISLLAAAALLFAAPVAAQRARTAAPYRALGTEPFWSVTIGGGRMTYDDPERGRFSVATPPARPSFNGRRYVTGRLTVDITRRPCSDGMSDRNYADTVEVVVEGRRLSGCGGAFTEEAGIADTRWRIVAIGRAQVANRDGYTLAFTGDRISGQAGCNRFSGPYRVTAGGILHAGPFAVTRMACPPPRMMLERAVLRVLSAPMRMAEPDANTEMLTSSGGTIRLRRVQ